MKRIALCAALLAAVMLAGCAGNSSAIAKRSRETKTAFTPFYERHLPEEQGTKRAALEEFWTAWETWIQEYEK